MPVPFFALVALPRGTRTAGEHSSYTGGSGAVPRWMRLSKAGETELLLEISPCVAQQEQLGYVTGRAGEPLCGQHTCHQLLSTFAKFLGCLRATLCFLSECCRYETTSELNREGP